MNVGDVVRLRDGEKKSAVVKAIADGVATVEYSHANDVKTIGVHPVSALEAVPEVKGASKAKGS